MHLFCCLGCGLGYKMWTAATPLAKTSLPPCWIKTISCLKPQKKALKIILWTQFQKLTEGTPRIGLLSRGFVFLRQHFNNPLDNSQLMPPSPHAWFSPTVWVTCIGHFCLWSLCSHPQGAKGFFGTSS